MIDTRDTVTSHLIKTRQPKIVLENNPLQNHQEALERWKQAKENFINTLNRRSE